jgi:hypothetical protein
MAFSGEVVGPRNLRSDASHDVDLDQHRVGETMAAAGLSGTRLPRPISYRDLRLRARPFARWLAVDLSAVVLRALELQAVDRRAEVRVAAAFFGAARLRAVVERRMRPISSQTCACCAIGRTPTW